MKTSLHTPATNRVLKTAHQIAKEKGFRYVGSECLLLAMCRLGDKGGGGGAILGYFSITEDRVKKELGL